MKLKSLLVIFASFLLVRAPLAEGEAIRSNDFTVDADEGG